MKSDFNQDPFFDIKHPSRVGPSPTSKPIIVGHRPEMIDPMMRQRPHSPRPIDISEPDALPSTTSEPTVLTETQPMHLHPESVAASDPGPSHFDPRHGLPIQHHSTSEDNQPESNPSLPSGPAHDNSGHQLSVDHFKMHWWGWLVLLFIGAIIGMYLAIDSGLVRGASHLPFHVFTQKVASVDTTSPGAESLATAPTSTASSPSVTVPSSWKSATSTSEKLTLWYPATWKLTDNSNLASNQTTAGASKGDLVELTKGELQLQFQAGDYVAPVTTSLTKISEQTTTFAGQPAKLTFYSSDTQTPKMVERVILTDTTGKSFATKNITLTNGSSSTPGVLNVELDYLSPTTGKPVGKTMDQITADADFKDAKLMIQAMSY